MRTIFLSWLTLSACVLTGGSLYAQSTAYQKALSLYRENKLSQALPEFEAAAIQDDTNSAVYAWLAETLRRLGKKQEAVVAARKSLELDPCNSFAHLVIADASNPTYGEWAGASEDTTWTHLMEAVNCDSSDGNAWLDVWVEAIKHNDIPLMQRASGRLIETGFLTNTLLAYAKWTMRSLPQNAILITNGDMDTFPLSAVQVADGFRPDVAIVNRSLLNTPWYARYVRDYEKVPLPFNDKDLDALAQSQDSTGSGYGLSARICRSWLEEKEAGDLKRPLAISSTVEPGWYMSDSSHISVAGPYLLWTNGPRAKIIDTTLALASFGDMRPADFAGAWVSVQDRSSVRIVGTDHMVLNIIYVAYLCSRAMMKAHNYAGASHWLDWADELDSTCELGPVWAKYIEQWRNELNREIH